MLIDKLLSQDIKYAMSLDDIKLATFDKFPVIVSRYLQLSDIPQVVDMIKAKQAIILLVLPPGGNSGHYVTFVYSKYGMYSYYDSYGKHHSFYNNEILNGIIDYIVLKRYKFEVNALQQQEIKRDVNVCGKYAVLRAFCNDMSNKEFNQLMDSTVCISNDSDRLVSLMTVCLGLYLRNKE
jgi:hypothetical protein